MSFNENEPVLFKDENGEDMIANFLDSEATEAIYSYLRARNYEPNDNDIKLLYYYKNLSDDNREDVHLFMETLFDSMMYKRECSDDPSKYAYLEYSQFYHKLDVEEINSDDIEFLINCRRLSERNQGRVEQFLINISAKSNAEMIPQFPVDYKNKGTEKNKFKVSFEDGTSQTGVIFSISIPQYDNFQELFGNIFCPIMFLPCDLAQRNTEEYSQINSIEYIDDVTTDFYDFSEWEMSIIANMLAMLSFKAIDDEDDVVWDALYLIDNFLAEKEHQREFLDIADKYSRLRYEEEHSEEIEEQRRKQEEIRKKQEAEQKHKEMLCDAKSFLPIDVCCLIHRIDKKRLLNAVRHNEVKYSHSRRGFSDEIEINELSIKLLKLGKKDNDTELSEDIIRARDAHRWLSITECMSVNNIPKQLIIKLIKEKKIKYRTERFYYFKHYFINQLSISDYLKQSKFQKRKSK